MTTREKGLLWFSVAVSIGIWSFIYGPLLGVIFTFSLLFHEYGHYYWMGREGSQKRSMMMMPPFGAVAMCEPFEKLGSEARMALAGPGFGLVPAVVLSVAQQFYQNHTIGIAIWLICWFNLFNLLAPIAVLDGGRVLKVLALSINTRLGFRFYDSSIIVLFLLVVYFFSVFTLFMGILVYNMLKGDRQVVLQMAVSDKLVKMTSHEAIVAIRTFAAIGLGLWLVMLNNNVWYADFVEFIKNR